MKLRRKLLQYIPFPILKYYRRAKKVFKKSFLFDPARKLYHRIKRLFESGEDKLRLYNPTGTHSDLIKRLELDSVFLTEKNIDSINVTRYMEWQNPFNHDDFGKYQYKREIIKCSDNSIDIAFNNYGLWSVELEYLSGEKVERKEKRTVPIEAPEYNIAYLRASLPAILFLCKLWNITKPECPSIVGLERVLFDYDKLPRNVYPFPMASRKELNTAYVGFDKYAQRVVAYLGHLYKMNPEAKFHLYIGDHPAYYMLPIMYANQIPEKNFTVHILSDGVGSYECSEYVFGKDNDNKKFLNMKKTWEVSRQMAVDSGVQEWGRENFIHYGKPTVSETEESKIQVELFSTRIAYSSIAADRYDNVEWVLHDPGRLRKKPKHAVAMDFKECLKILEVHRTEFCDMINLDKSIFDASIIKNKKICMLLGTNPETHEFRKYIEATMKYFGSDYDYYLKSHPGVVADEDRNKKLTEQGIKLLDSKIPTEIYMMLNPDIYLAGYLSSTFLSVSMLRDPETQILSVWDRNDRKIKTASLDFVSRTSMNIENSTVRIYD